MTQNEEAIKRIITNIKCTIIVFPPAEGDKVIFNPYKNIKADNGRISFSTIVTISQKEEWSEELDLELVWLGSQPKDEYKICKLDKISLDRNVNMKTHEHDISSDNRFWYDPYVYTGAFRYNFYDIPVPEFGNYALSLVKNDDDGFTPIESFYFEVVK